MTSRSSLDRSSINLRGVCSCLAFESLSVFFSKFTASNFFFSLEAVCCAKIWVGVITIFTFSIIAFAHHDGEKN